MLAFSSLLPYSLEGALPELIWVDRRRKTNDATYSTALAVHNFGVRNPNAEMHTAVATCCTFVVSLRPPLSCNSYFVAFEFIQFFFIPILSYIISLLFSPHFVLLTFGFLFSVSSVFLSTSYETSEFLEFD